MLTAIDRLGHSVAEVTRTIADLGERRTLLRACPAAHGGTANSVIWTVVDRAGAYKNDRLALVVP